MSSKKIFLSTKYMDHELLESHLKCCVCKDLYVFPRQYNCGHSCCEKCMAQIDRHTAAPSSFHLTIYSCPMCRHKTIIPWYHREPNIALRRIVECHPNYEERMKEHGERQKVIAVAITEDDVDLEAVCTNARQKEADRLYRTFYPLLFFAAKKGKQYVVISNLDDVQQIEPVADLFANMLIDKHNIYKLLITRSECTIMFTENAFHVGREFVRIEEEIIEEVAEDILDNLTEELAAIGTRLPLLNIP